MKGNYMKKCIICREEIFRGGILTSKVKTKRQLHSVTCSRKCSVIYQRIRNYIKGKEYRLNK